MMCWKELERPYNSIYLPCGYLRSWLGLDGPLVPFNDRICHPKEHNHIGILIAEAMAS